MSQVYDIVQTVLDELNIAPDEGLLSFCEQCDVVLMRLSYSTTALFVVKSNEGQNFSHLPDEKLHAKFFDVLKCEGKRVVCYGLFTNAAMPIYAWFDSSSHSSTMLGAIALRVYSKVIDPKKKIRSLRAIARQDDNSESLVDFICHEKIKSMPLDVVDVLRDSTEDDVYSRSAKKINDIYVDEMNKILQAEKSINSVLDAIQTGNADNVRDIGEYLRQSLRH